ncbi:MAG: SH3 domain-containing protein [bacterium]|nr:SH3 domain-containing protein [bacterium]
MSPFFVRAICVFVIPAALAAAADPVAEAPAQPEPFVGEVTGDDVYVRSGPSTNYYPVTKLNAGTRVTVVGAEGEWVSVVPPDGCFSLVADSFVDPGDGIRGVINGRNVRVRCGSNLYPDKRYAIQQKLAQGVEVEILGHLERAGADDWGYYQIAPPPGAKVWISAKYVQRVPEELLRREAAGQAVVSGAADVDSTVAQPGDPALAARTERDQVDADLVVNTESADGPAASTDPTVIKERIKDYRAQIESIDADLTAELAKPLFRRDLESLIDRFTPLANQEHDEYSAVYAATRISQLRDMAEMIAAVGQIRQMGEQIKTDRKTALAARATIRPTIPTIEHGFDIEGELRFSAIYDSPIGPRRYRLVDPTKSDAPRTLGYVEIPPDSSIDVEEYIGRLVGVRAREITLQTGEVDPVRIYLAAELTLLDTPAPGAELGDAG